MNFPIYLSGHLAAHRRRRMLQEVFGSEILQDPAHKPDSGLCILFGNDYQAMLEPLKQAWLAWFQQPGCSLLLVPPFEAGPIGIPTDWEIRFRDDAASAETDGLSRLLEGEVQFEIRGNQIQVDVEQGHRWADFSLNTAYFKPHSHSGLLGVTVLPIWSLSVLGHEELLRIWLTALHANAGTARAGDDPSQGYAEFRLDKQHYTLMVHLWSMPLASREASLAALEESEILQLPAANANQGLQELETAGLCQGGQLTKAGIGILQNSPYWEHAKALRSLMQ